MGVWSLEPSVLIGTALLAAGYLFVTWPARVRAAGVEPVTGWRRVAFLAGVGVLALALASPLDLLADRYLFSAHMVQHMLMTLAVPPLLLLGTPEWMVRPLLRSWLVESLLRALTRPLTAFVLFNVVFGLSHFPVFYNLTLADERVHVLEHALYLGTAVLMWWPILSPTAALPRLSYPLQMLYLFLQTLPCVLIGSSITLAEEPLYPTYVAAPRIVPLSPLADQQLGGLIMWVGGAFFFFFVLTIIFFTWAHREEKRSWRPI